MNLKKLLGLQTQSEKLAEYLHLSRELEKVTKDSQLMVENFSINKSQLDSLNGENDPFVVKSITSRYAAFLKQHQSDVINLCNRKTQIEKSMKNIEKDADLAEVVSDYKQISEVKKGVKSGSISKAFYYDLLKAKEGVVRYADVLLFKEDKLLILQRAENGMFSNKWCVPGGHVDPGEDFITAAQRELFEETGIDIPKNLLSEAAVYKDKDVEIHYFIGNMDPKSPGVVIVDSMEEIGSAWITPATDLEDYDFIFDMKENLKRILGMEQEDCCVRMLKSFTDGEISSSVFKDFCDTHKDEIRKSQNKNNFSHSERKDLAEKGEAMPDGKYPIRNAQDLKDAIRLSGSSDTAEYKVRNWIKKRAKELDLEKELPEDWSSSDSKEKGMLKAEDTSDAQILAKESLDGEVTGPQGSGIGENNLEKSHPTKKRMTIDCNDEENNLLEIIEAIKKCGNGGRSFTIVIDPDPSEKDGNSTKLRWDCDGNCSIAEIKVEDKEDLKKSETFDVNVGFNDLEHAELFKSLVEDWKSTGKLDVATIGSGNFEKEDPIEKSEEPMKQTFVGYLNFIEGAKTRLKNIHWSEEDSAKHINLDDLSENVSEFEDKISEASQANFGRFKDGEIQGEEVEESDPVKIAELLYKKTKELRKVVEGNDDYNGEISWIDDFLASLKQSKYRLQMH